MLSITKLLKREQKHFLKSVNENGRWTILRYINSIILKFTEKMKLVKNMIFLFLICENNSNLLSYFSSFMFLVKNNIYFPTSFLFIEYTYTISLKILALGFYLAISINNILISCRFTYKCLLKHQYKITDIFGVNKITNWQITISLEIIVWIVFIRF